MVGSWEVVIATLHTDLVHNLLVPLIELRINKAIIITVKQIMN